MSLTVCIAPAHTMAYPNGGGHLWVSVTEPPQSEASL
jgi:hypothetical protein